MKTNELTNKDIEERFGHKFEKARKSRFSILATKKSSGLLNIHQQLQDILGQNSQIKKGTIDR